MENVSYIFKVSWTCYFHGANTKKKLSRCAIENQKDYWSSISFRIGAEKLPEGSEGASFHISILVADENREALKFIYQITPFEIGFGSTDHIDLDCYYRDMI